MALRVLLITPQFPLVADSGGLYKTKRLIEHLAVHYQLTIYSLYAGPCGNGLDTARIQNRRERKPRDVRSFLSSLMRKVPLSVYRNKFNEIGPEINELCAHADVILVDHFLSFQYVPRLYYGKTVYHAHNAEYVMWQKAAAVEHNLLKRALIMLEAHRVKDYELKICRNVRTILAAPNDENALIEASGKEDKRRALSGKFVETYHLGPEPSGDNLSLFKKPSSADHTLRICFVGNLFWDANVDGIMWFLAKCWEKISDLLPQAELVVIGKGPEQLLAKMAQYNKVSVLGFIEDVEPVLSTVDVFVCPLRFGSGMKVKNTLALYRGIPLVTTPVGAEGFQFENHQDAVIASDDAEMVDAIYMLANDYQLRLAIGQNGKLLADKKYNWAHVFAKIDEALSNGC